MTLHSMTAFARESCTEPAAIVVELRSVNQRYLDCHFKLPDALRALEPRMREAFGAKLKRGKIDTQLRVLSDDSAGELRIDHARLGSVVALLDELRTAAPELRQPDALALLAFPGVCVGDGGSEDELLEGAFALFERALETLVDSRAREGEQLAGFLGQRIDSVAATTAQLRGELPALRERQEERLRRRLAELDAEADETRLEQELVYLAQKSDVDEELDRIDAHVHEVRRILERGGPCGRRLDFLMQEFNREANTLASKSTAGSTTQAAVELKVLIEQMREQVQNIE
jgi:uncharacterized protein (TIGR00255 family)